MQIIRRLESLRGREHAATCDLIEALVTCHRTKAHVDAGHASVWDLLVRRLKYSPAAASRRNAAMKFVLASPRAMAMLRAHRTNLTALAKAVSLLKTTDADAVLDAIVDKSADDVERAIATFRPWRPPVESVRRIVVATGVGVPGAVKLDDVKPDEVTPDEVESDELTPDEVTPKRSAPETPSPKPVLSSAAEPHRRVALRFSVEESTFAKFERAKAILSRKHPCGLKLEDVFDELLDFYLEKKSPKERAAKPAPPKASRHVPAATRDHVFHRDGAQCTYVARDGTRCVATHDLQIDHVRPWARGGTHDASNLRILCGQHNRRRNDGARG